MKSALVIALANLQLTSASPEVRRQAIELLGRQTTLKPVRNYNLSPVQSMNLMPAFALPPTKV